MIWAACGIGAVGIAIAAVAPNVPVALLGGFLFGASAGSFLAVDWALMTDIIPRASAGRYMGLSNVATASATTLGLAIGGVVLDLVTRAGYLELSPRAVFALGVALYVAAAITLRPVVEPPRGRAGADPAAGADAAAGAEAGSAA